MKILKITNVVINAILLILLGISLIGAISILPDNISGISLSFVKVVDVVILLVAILLIYRQLNLKGWQQFISIIKNVFSRKITWIVLFSAILIWQLLCVFLLSGTSTWDWMFLVQRATTSKLGWPWPNYLSVNPNNTMLLKIENIYWHLLGRPSFQHFMYALNIANVAIVDVSTYLIWKLAKKFTTTFIAKWTLLWTLLIFTLVPFFVIPYSDTISFFLTSILLFTIVKITEIKKRKQVLAYSILLGFQFLLAYLIKPSLMVILAALVLIILLLFVSKSKNNNIGAMMKVTILAIILLGIGFVGMKNYLYNHNGIVKVDTRQALPMSHFAAMGITGDGDYSVSDMFNSANIKDPVARNRASLHLIKERFINQGGIWWYQKFLIHKQIKNSADGTMAWGHENYYLKAFNPDNKRLSNTFPRKYFLESNGIATEKKYNFRTVQQIIWIVLIILMLFSTLDCSVWGLFLKISAVGFFAFLLLFEGGRSRYLIQFLPILLLLTSLGMSQLHQKLFFRAKS